MIHGDIDMAPPPESTLQLTRLRGGGWLLIHDGQSEVAFTNASDMIRWLSENVEPLERTELPEPVSLPSVLQAARPEQRGVWSIFQGGKR